MVIVNKMLSVVMLTYGHENFIEDAINGVLEQKCYFGVELIIANDNSPDKTDQIINNILKNHPNSNWIKYINRTHNIGIGNNFINAINKCSGKYIALCDGDDYWTDPFKLQKQVDFLEANPEYAICHHQFDTYLEETQVLESNKKIEDLIPEEYGIEYLSKSNSIGTLTAMFRNRMDNMPDSFERVLSGDYVLHLLNAANGKIKYIKETMAVYRRHKKSVTGDFKGIEGSLFLIDTIRPLLEGNFIKHPTAINNLKAQLVNCYLVLLAHFHSNRDRPSFLEWFVRLQFLKDVFYVEGVKNEELIKYYLIHINWLLVERNILQSEKLVEDFDNIQVQILLKAAIRLIKENLAIKSSWTFVMGNKIKKVFQ